MNISRDKKITVPEITKMKAEGRKIPVLTAYSCEISALLDRAGIPVILVGDSVGMVEAGSSSTLPVTMDEMTYHTRSVSRGARNALIVADMPFMSYQVSIEEAKRNAGRLIKEGGAESVKLEGGVRVAQTIRAITDMDIPVMAHIGLTPQSINKIGGYKVQGKEKNDAERIMEDAFAVEEAGAFAVVLECIPTELSVRITAALSIPTIGIGAGSGCDGQVMVVNDFLGLGQGGGVPRFVRSYADLDTVILTATERYIRDVYQGKFPSDDESYS